MGTLTPDQVWSVLLWTFVPLTTVAATTMLIVTCRWRRKE